MKDHCLLVQRLVFASLLGCGLLGMDASGLEIQFDYRYDSNGFFDDPVRRQTLEAAGKAWEQALDGVETPAIPVGTGGNTWTLSFNRPDVDAGFGVNNTSLVNQPLAANTIVVYVGARPNVYGGFYGYAEFAWSASGTPSWVGSFQERLSGNTFLSVGGAIAFKSDVAWHFDASPETVEAFPLELDFYTFALHEIGHLLGFTPGVSAYLRRTLGGTFRGAAVEGIYGARPPVGTGGHWPGGFQLDGKGLVMGVDIQYGERQFIHPMEAAVLQDMGYGADGELQVVLGPAGALSGGARWILDGEPERVSGAVRKGLPEGRHSLSFKAVNGFVTPEAREVEITKGELSVVEVDYVSAPVPQGFDGPGSYLLQVGVPLEMTVTGSGDGGVLSYRWTRAGKKVVGALGSVFEKLAVTLKDAGVYRVLVRSDTGSASAVEGNVGVVGEVTGVSGGVVNEGARLELRQVAAGPGLRYRWLYEGQPLSNDAVAGVSGADTARLRVAGVKPAAAGAYRCEVRMPRAGGGEDLVELGPERVIEVLPRPVVVDQDLGMWRVSGVVMNQFEAEDGPGRFEITGLPRGVGYVKSNGQLFGRPLVAGGFTLRVRALNAAGWGEWKSFPVTVDGLPEGVEGVFYGVMERGYLNRDLGGAVELRVTGAGGYSGKVVLAGRTQRIKGVVDHEVGVGGGSEVSVDWGLSRRAGVPRLLLYLNWDADERAMLGWMADEGQAEVGLRAVRSGWHARSNPAGDYVGNYTVAIERVAIPAGEGEGGDGALAEPSVRPPEGMGFLRIGVAGSGVARVSGRMADGGKWTGALRLSDDGALGVHKMLSGGLASAQGWLGLSRGDVGEPWEVDGMLSWAKVVTVVRGKNYPAGFPLHDLVVRGGVYEAVSLGQRVLGIAVGPVPNARLELSGYPAGLMGVTGLDFELDERNRMVVAGANPGLFQLRKLDVKTGLFEGSFVDEKVVRFYGLLVPRLGRGVGYFLVPEKGVAVPRLLSGGVVLRGLGGD